MILSGKRRNAILLAGLAIVLLAAYCMVKSPVYVINVNGESVIAFQTLQEAELVLNRIIDSYDRGEAEYTSTYFVEEVAVAEAYGDDVPVAEDLDAAYAILREEYLTVKTTGFFAETEAIDFEIDYEETDVLYFGEAKIKEVGEEGSKAIVTKIEIVDGEVVSTAKVSEAVLQEPKRQTVLIGVREGPSLETLGYPTRGKLTSRYGIRWNRQHKGIDLAAENGTPIYAAESGTVVYAQYNTGGYGYLVKISHSDQFETWYAHCSQILVSAGDEVKKGDLLAEVGSTGNSTGNHLHFEIRIDEEAVDPLAYLDFEN